MSAQNTDKLIKLSRRWVSQIGSGGVADENATTIPLSSVTNLPTDTAVIAVIDRVDVNGTATPTLEETVVGVVSSTNLINCTRGVEGTAQAHSAGAVVEVLFTAAGWNKVVDWGLVEHSQLGVHDKTKVVDLTTAQTLTNKTLTSPLFNGTVDGWISANETWTYASASTITVPSGAAAKYAVGDRIRWKQGAGYKYGVLVAVADTLLTIAVNTDFTVATPTAITDNYYSHQISPIGYPQWFNFVPTFTSGGGAFTNAPTVNSARFLINGTHFFAEIDYSYHATSGGTGATTIQALPVTSTKNFSGSTINAGTAKAGALLGTTSNYFNIYLYDGTTMIANSNRIFVNVNFEF